MIILCIILFIIAIELGAGLYLYAEANSPAQTNIFANDKHWWEEVPDRLKAKPRTSHEDRATGASTSPKEPKVNLNKLKDRATVLKNRSKSKVVAGGRSLAAKAVPRVSRRARKPSN